MTYFPRRRLARQPASPIGVELLEARNAPGCIAADPFLCTPLPLSHEGLVVHIHPQVHLFINGREQPVPGNLGVTPQGMLPIHTHDGTGRLHVESPVPRTFTLKDFFDSWGQPFGKNELLGHLTPSIQPITMTVNGQLNSTYGALTLRDFQDIIIRADGAISAGGLGTAATVFTHSAEHYQYFVTQAYQEYLGRSPDQGGLQTWVGLMQRGLTDEQLEASFLAAPEYLAKQGGTSNLWVRGMYRDLLGRTPDTAGLQGWIARLEAGARRYDVALGFAASAEREGIRVREDYRIFLGRTPGQAEVDGWVNAFVRGMTNEKVVAGFVGSREYFFSPTKGNGDLGTWVRTVYQDVLHRAPSDAEVNTWATFIRQQ